ncbi:MAG: hypothetical protein ACOC4M_14365, partial [Promethearchaeia archaeon]
DIIHIPVKDEKILEDRRRTDKKKTKAQQKAGVPQETSPFMDKHVEKISRYKRRKIGEKEDFDFRI